MYSPYEKLAISYVNTLNNLIQNEKSTDDENNYLLRKTITDAISELENNGCKIRVSGNMLVLVEVNEGHILSRL